MNRNLRCLGTLVLLLAPMLTDGAEPKRKPVSLAWFPRFSADSAWLITAHGSWKQEEGGEVRVWDVRTGELKFAITADHGVRTVAWAPKGSFFVSGDYGGKIRFYDAESGESTGELKAPASVEVLVVSPDEKKLFTAHGNGTVLVWDLSAKKIFHSFRQMHQGGIWGMTLSDDGTTLSTAGKDQRVRVFDVATLTIVHELAHPGETNGLAFTKDTKTLFTGCIDGVIRRFDVENGELVGELRGHDRGNITDLALSPDGELLASSGVDQTVRLWDLKDAEQPRLSTTLRGHTSLVFGVAISADMKWLASVDWNDKVIIWDLKMRKQQWSR